MTTYNKATLKTFFETGDVPSGTDYANLIDSCLNLVETAEQAMAGPLNTTKLITPTVSATNFNISGSLNCTGNVSAFFQGQLECASDVNFGSGQLLVGSVSCLNNMSVGGSLTLGNSLLCVGAIYASAGANVFSLSVSGGDINAPRSMITASAPTWSVGIVSAAGSAQSTAAQLIYMVNHGRGIVDGQTTGFILPSNGAGRIQHLFNSGASANLWPCIGGTINGQAANAVFPLAASALYTIVHIGASAYAVK